MESWMTNALKFAFDGKADDGYGPEQPLTREMQGMISRSGLDVTVSYLAGTQDFAGRCVGTKIYISRSIRGAFGDIQRTESEVLETLAHELGHAYHAIHGTGFYLSEEAAEEQGKKYLL